MKSLSSGFGWMIAAIAIVGVLSAAGVARAAHHARSAANEEGGTHSRGRGRAAPPPAVPLDQIRVFGDRPAPFALDAHAAMLIDARSGDLLYAYNEHERMQPASLAKMMTFYLTLQALSQKRVTLDTPVPISEAAWRLSLNNSVSRMFLQVGQRVPLKDLLYGLMVSSGNDAAVALSEYLAGSQDAFAEQMNDQAAKLGLSETHFANPDGLPVDGEYTTAADMVKLGRALIVNFPMALDYTSTKEFTFDKITQRNFNTLLFYDARVDGIKTGHVQEAGYHLVASARTPDMQLISAVMGTPSMEKRRVETDKLLDWAFRTFTTVSPDWHRAAPADLRVYQGDVDRVPIAPAGGTPYFTVSRGDETRVTLAATFPPRPLVAPLAQGTPVGELAITIAGKPVSSVPLITQTAVGEGGIVHRMADAVRLRL
ncbi:MAG: D-alanyl-D-alanine carboxypeptidase [Candidatus Binataceae bacterium]|nr:D-alanyl-D-alanine carboxypeptidase [Candidatus Binataceae bacterium]